MIYLDSAATSLIKPACVERAVLHAMRSMASPGRGGHEPAMKAAETVYACREEAAALFRAPDPSRVVFTMNATHGLNMAIRSLIKPGSRVVISGFEHNAVRRPLHHIGAQTIVAGRRLFDPEDTLRAFSEAVTWETKAVVVTHVSNVFGYILPIREIAQMCREREVPMILDAAQSAGILPVKLRTLGASFVCMPGHKGLYGPQGTGMLLCAARTRTLLEGGSGSESRLPDMPDTLPERLEAGTQNACGICALSEGLRFVSAMPEGRVICHERALRELLAQELSGLPDVRVFTGGAQAGTCSFTVRGRDCSELAAQLARRHIAVRAGLHCAPLAHESAGTLETGTVRVSFSVFNTRAEVLRFAQALREILTQ